MRKNILFNAVALLCLNFSASAQEKQILLRPVRGGEQVPDEFWNTPMQVYRNGKFTTENLMQYKGKVIVLDSWASWCGNCIEGFPKLKKLQDSLGDDLQVILVNKKAVRDDRAKVENVFNNNQAAVENMFTLVEDTLVNYLFPAVSLPTLVVINGDGYLTAVMEGSMFHPSNIIVLAQERRRVLIIRERYRQQKNVKP
ncbi:TlpA disulfide reductase family protein [Pedobacter frigidisoli]|uniref:TlpA family protein disulfide reductase n=1 Tax=Pedobacter frigidisoli TaxID=2530455 RepID=UPI00292CFE02|nr:TlpA disulfide reductase family protein [Pedobacter frigidisoli]